MIRYAAALAVLTLPASAGCIVNEDMAQRMFRIVAFTRMCPEYRAADDRTAMDLLLSAEAVVEDEANTSECRRLVAYRLAASTGRLHAPRALDAECAEARRAVSADGHLRGMLTDLGLLRSSVLEQR